MKHHLVIFIPAGLFKVACGIYLDGPDKERGTGLPHEVTCGNCKRTRTWRGQARWDRRCREQRKS